MTSTDSTVIEWTHDKIVVLTRHLANTGHGVNDVVYAVEKPWKFVDEYEEALLALTEYKSTPSA